MSGHFAPNAFEGWTLADKGHSVDADMQDDATRADHALASALVRLLRPLVRLLLRHGLPFAAFDRIARRLYVDVALHEFGIPGKKPSIARASILTGLTRKQVQQLMAAPIAPPDGSEARYNRAARVLTAWLREADFRDARGRPRALEVDGAAGFAELVRRHSGDMPVRAVLDELLRVGAVRQRPDGCVELVARAYVPQRSAADQLHILGHDVADLITTIDHNLQRGDAGQARFQRKVMYHAIPVDALPAFRTLSAAQAQALLEKLDRWLAAHDADPSADAHPARARVGLGIYQFEEERRSPGDTEQSEP